MNSLRIGTRASALALAQARLVQDALQALAPGLPVEIIPIATTGDKRQDAPLSQIGGKGIFIKEIEEALLQNRVDLAVHSLKDLPTKAPAGLVIAAVPEREDPRDCLVSRFGEQLLELPRGSVVGTSALRRKAQVLAAKKGVRVEDMRGNLDTRLRKVEEGQVSAIVVAHAGVRRLKREGDVSEILPFELMLPAPGQGCIAVETRADDAGVRELAARLNHGPSARAAEAERSFLASLGGGCRVPIAAYAREESGAFVLDGLVIAPDGKKQVRGRLSGKPEDAAALGAALGKKLSDEGAGEILGSLEPEKPVAGA